MKKLMLAALCCIAASVTAAGQQSIPVFVNGTDGYKCYRIPAIIRTPNSTLIAFAEARRNNCGDFGDVAIVLRTSHDDGKTWGALTVAAENGGLQAGNPLPVVDTLDRNFGEGRVLLVYQTGNDTENNVRQGKGERRIWIKSSIDDGATWSDGKEITAETKLPSWRAYGTGPGHGLQLTAGPHKGRIVIGSYHSEGGPDPEEHDYAAHTIYSDDHGRTWKMGASVSLPGSNESSLAQRGDGAVVMNSRDQSKGSLARMVSISKDGGKHWDSSVVAQDLPDPRCEGSMIAYAPTNKKQWLLFSNSGNGIPGKRQNLNLSMSSDGGITWSKHTLLHEGPAAYSDLVLIGDRLGILWESAAQQGIVFLVTPVAPLL